MPDHSQPAQQFTLEELERQQAKRMPGEDGGVSDEALDEARITEEALLDTSDTLPSERAAEADSTEDRGGSRVDDEARGEKRRQQYEDGADFVSELD